MICDLFPINEVTIHFVKDINNKIVIEKNICCLNKQFNNTIELFNDIQQNKHYINKNKYNNIFITCVSLNKEYVSSKYLYCINYADNKKINKISLYDIIMEYESQQLLNNKTNNKTNNIHLNTDHKLNKTNNIHLNTDHKLNKTNDYVNKFETCKQITLNDLLNMINSNQPINKSTNEKTMNNKHPNDIIINSTNNTNTHIDNGCLSNISKQYQPDINTDKQHNKFFVDLLNKIIQENKNSQNVSNEEHNLKLDAFKQFLELNKKDNSSINNNGNNQLPNIFTDILNNIIQPNKYQYIFNDIDDNEYNTDIASDDSYDDIYP